MAVINQIIVIFSLIIIGYIVRKLDIVSEVVNREISRFVLYVSMPAFLLSSMNFKFSVEILKESGILVLISFCVYGVSILISKFYSKVMGNESAARAVIEYVIVFSNCGFMGYPVVSQIFGEKGLFYAAIYNLSFNILIWTYGVRLLRSASNKVKLTFKERLMHLVNPGIVAIAIGYFMFLTNLSFPEVIQNLLKLVGGTTTPLSMMLIGFILTEVSFKSSLVNIQLWYVSFIRLVFIPALTFLVLNTLSLKGLTLYIPVIITAMPAAVNTAVFASEHGGDYKLGSLLIFSSTFLSALTIPLLLLLFK